MPLFGGHELHNLNDLLVTELKGLYDAEMRLEEALPEMADAAHTPELAEMFRQHQVQTQGHAKRIEEIFGKIGQPPIRESSSGMKGLLEESRTIAKSKGDHATCDAGLILAAQRVEHYEIASYGAARTFAQMLGLKDVAEILQQTLAEAESSDKRLSQIAESSVNTYAIH